MRVAAREVADIQVHRIPDLAVGWVVVTFGQQDIGAKVDIAPPERAEQGGSDFEVLDVLGVGRVSLLPGSARRDGPDRADYLVEGQRDG
jgi:hypothetical protein